MSAGVWLRSRPVTFWVGAAASAAMCVFAASGAFDRAIDTALNEPADPSSFDQMAPLVAAFCLVMFAALTWVWSFDRPWARLLGLFAAFAWLMMPLMIFVMVTFTAGGGRMPAAFAVPAVCGAAMLIAVAVDQARASRPRVA